MARAGADFQTFEGRANAGGNFASVPFDDGGAARTAAAVFANLGATLGKLADQAIVKKRYQEGLTVTTDSLALPETYVDRTVQKGAPAVQDQAVRGNPAVAGGGDGSKSLGSVKARAAMARGYYEKLGYAPHQASAIVGNLLQESTLRTSVVGDKSIPGGSVGIGQWNRERKAALLGFAQSKGKPWTDFETQLAFVHHELQTSESAAGNALRKAGNVDDATAAMVGFERPIGWTPQNPRGGSGWKNRISYAQQVLGGSAAALPAGPAISSGVPQIAAAPAHDIVTEQIRFRIPDTKPLALRNDGTLGGNAYDQAVKETATWRMAARVDAAFNNIYADHKDDPAAFDAAMKETSHKILEDAGAYGPEVKQAMAQRIVDRSMADIQKINSVREDKANEERKTAATAALDAQDQLVERQAYALGATQNGDKQLGELTQKALGSIDAAVASNAITPDEGRRKREATLQSMTVSRIKGVFDALPTPAEKQRFADGLMQEWQAKDSPLGHIGLSTMESLVGNLQTQAGQAKDKANTASAFDKAKFASLLNDDVASVAANGVGVAPGGQPLDFATVEKTLGTKEAYQWLEQRDTAKALHDATAGLVAMTPQDIAARLKATKPAPGEDNFAVKQAAYVAAQKQAAAVMKERQDNPAGAVDAAFPEIADMASTAKLEDPASLAALMNARAHGAEALGIAPSAQLVLTDAEAKALATGMAQGPEQAVQLTMAVTKASGTRVDSVMRQISDHAPALAVGADIAARGGTTEALQYVAQQQAVERDPAYKKPELPPAKLTGAAAATDAAFSALPERAGAVRQNAATIFKAMAREQGIAPDLDSEEGQKVFERAVQVAAGASFRGGKQIGGITDVNGLPTLVPIGVTASDVQATLQGLTDEQFKALPPIQSANGVEVRAADLRDAYLVAVGDGIYRVARGDPRSDNPRYLAGPDGNYWTLNWRSIPLQTVPDFQEMIDPTTGVVMQ